jgi:hypothetical protein
MVRKVLIAILLVLFASTAFADNKMVVLGTDDSVVIEAEENRVIEIRGLMVIATSTTSVEFTLYNEDNYVLGDASTPITVDLDGIDGPVGFIMPTVAKDVDPWLVTDAANEALKINLSSSTKVIVVVIYTYRKAY